MAIRNILALLLVTLTLAVSAHKHELPRDGCTVDSFPTNDPVTDYIQAGFGGAGSFVVWHLVNDLNCTSMVHVFEAGEDVNSEFSVLLPLLSGATLKPDGTIRPGSNTKTDWNYRGMTMNDGIIPSNYTPAYPRAHSIGGSTSHHAMVYFRPTDGDLITLAQVTEDARFLPVNALSFIKAIENNTYYKNDTTWHGASGPISLTRHGSKTTLRPEPIANAFIDIASTYFNISKTGVNGNLDPNGNQQYRKGVGYWQRTVFDADFGALGGKRSYPGNTVYPAIMGRCPAGTVNVHTHAQIVRVIMDGTRAIGIEYIDGDGTDYAVDPRYNYTATNARPIKRMYARRGVILSLGTFNTVQIAELSGIGQRKVLDNLNIPLVKELPGVGENFQDHPEIVMVFDETPFNPYNFSIPSFMDGLRYGNSNYTPCNVSASAAGDYFNDPCAAEWYFNGTGPYTTNFIPVGMDWFSSDYGKQLDPYGDCHISLINGAMFRNWDTPTIVDIFKASLFVELHKMEGRGNVHIRSRNATAPPSLDLGYMRNMRDLARLANCSNLARNIMNHPAWQTQWNFTSITEEADTANITTLDQWIQFFSNNLYGHHGSSTMAMGSRMDPMSVTDSYGRIWGTQNLYIADLSIVPVISDGNPQGMAFLMGSMMGKSITNLELQPGRTSSRTTCTNSDNSWAHRVPKLSEPENRCNNPH